MEGRAQPSAHRHNAHAVTLGFKYVALPAQNTHSHQLTGREAIGLKTQSFPMIMAACGPLIITAILWRHVGNRKTTGQIIGEMEDWRKEKKIVSVFEHDLLKLDWAPELHILPEDEKEFEKALDHPKYGDSLRSLLGMEIKKRRKKETKRG